MIMKRLDFLQLPTVRLLRKFYWNILTNEGEGDNFLGLTLENGKLSNLYCCEKGARLQYFANFFFVV